MRGKDYLVNRKAEMSGGGRVAEIEAADEIVVALIYEANSKVGKRIRELEAEVVKLKAENRQLRSGVGII